MLQQKIDVSQSYMGLILVIFLNVVLVCFLLYQLLRSYIEKWKKKFGDFNFFRKRPEDVKNSGSPETVENPRMSVQLQLKIRRAREKLFEEIRLRKLNSVISNDVVKSSPIDRDRPRSFQMESYNYLSSPQNSSNVGLNQSIEFVSPRGA